MSDKNKNKCKAKMLIRDGFLSTTIAILSSLDLFVIPKEVVRKKRWKIAIKQTENWPKLSPFYLAYEITYIMQAKFRQKFWKVGTEQTGK